MRIYNDGKRHFTVEDIGGKTKELAPKKTIEVSDIKGNLLIKSYRELKDADNFMGGNKAKSEKQLKSEIATLNKELEKKEAAKKAKKKVADDSKKKEETEDEGKAEDK